MVLRTINSINPAGKKVLVRVDFNVPVVNGVISDDTRIRRALPTLKNLLDRDAALIVMSHLGRPKGTGKPEIQYDPDQRAFIGVIRRPCCDGPGCHWSRSGETGGRTEKRRNPAPGRIPDSTVRKQIMMLISVNHWPDLVICMSMMHLVRRIVLMLRRWVWQNCFRQQGGLLMEKECTFFDRVLEKPEKPFIAIIGGAKVSSKIAVLESLLNRVNAFVIGGGMAYTFMKVQGKTVGTL